MHKCPHCDFTSIKWAELETHRKGHAKIYVCDTCEKSFKDAASLLRHQAQKHSDDAEGNLKYGVNVQLKTIIFGTTFCITFRMTF